MSPAVPDHPETTALRLAEAATPGPWVTYPTIGDSIAVCRPWQLTGPGVGRHVIALHATPADASHIAHAHPGRVRAWLGAVARLRERVAEGHTRECRAERRWDERRGLFGECTCGHEDDLAALAAVDAEG